MRFVELLNRHRGRRQQISFGPNEIVDDPIMVDTGFMVLNTVVFLIEVGGVRVVTTLQSKRVSIFLSQREEIIFRRRV